MADNVKLENLTLKVGASGESGAVGGLNMNSKVLPNLADGVASNDGVNKRQLEEINPKGDVLNTKYLEQVVSFGIQPPDQWISAQLPAGLNSHPASYPFMISRVNDIMPGSTNTYTIDLNGGAPLSIVKDGKNGNAFHFTGNQSLYTIHKTVSTYFTQVFLVRKPVLNNGRLITGFINASTNNLAGYWKDKQDAWHIQVGGKLDVSCTTDFLLYIFTNNNDTKEMFRYSGPGLTTVVQAATTIGGSNWGRTIYGRPLSLSDEAATNSYIFESMVFSRVISAPERAEIVSFFQSIYPYY